MDNICEGCELTEFQAIKNFYEEPEASITFLRNHGVLPTSVTCPKCSKPCTLRSDRPTWQCNGKISVPKTKKRKRCGFFVSDYKGTHTASVDD